MEELKNICIVMYLHCMTIKKFETCCKVSLDDVIKNLPNTTKEIRIILKDCPKKIVLKNKARDQS